MDLDSRDKALSHQKGRSIVHLASTPCILALEGVSGCGKTTQVRLIAGRLRKAFPAARIAEVSEFSRSPVGGLLKTLARQDWRLVLTRKHRTALSETFLMVSDRLFKIESQIQDLRCDLIVTDRYELSNVAHGCTRMLAAYPEIRPRAAFEWFQKLFSLLPQFRTLSIFLDVPWSVCLQRVRRRGGAPPLSRKAAEEIRRSIDFYRMCSRFWPNVKALDGMQKPETLADLIYEEATAFLSPRTSSLLGRR